MKDAALHNGTKHPPHLIDMHSGSAIGGFLRSGMRSELFPKQRSSRICSGTPIATSPSFAKRDYTL